MEEKDSWERIGEAQAAVGLGWVFLAIIGIGGFYRVESDTGEIISFSPFLSQKPPQTAPRPSPTHLEEQATPQSQLSVLPGVLEWHLDIAAREGREGLTVGSSLQAPHRERKTESSPRRKKTPEAVGSPERDG